MTSLSYRRHRFPPTVIQHAIWLYLRFTLSYRDVEDLLAERGLEVSYQTVRRWVLKFGPLIRLPQHWGGFARRDPTQERGITMAQENSAPEAPQESFTRPSGSRLLCSPV